MSDRANRVARYTASALIAGGALVYMGWELRLGVLTGRSFGNLVPPNAALLFALIGASCLLQLSRKHSCVKGGQAIGLAVAGFSAATMAQYFSHADLGIDRILLFNRLSDWVLPTPPGRMALLTSFALLVAGLGLVSLQTRRGAPVAEGSAALVATISYLGFVGYAYRLPTLYGGLMALHTTILLALVALCLSTARSDSIVTSKQAGGVVFRRVIAPLLLLMPLLGFIEIQIQQVFSLRLEMATALLVVVAVLLFAGITAHTAGVVNAIDIERKRAEASLIRAEKLAAAGRLSATIAHEINNPLASVMNLLYLAKTTDSPAKNSEYIQMAEDELRRAAEIAKRTLGFYREDSQPQNVSLAAIAREVLELFRGKILALRLRLETDLDSAVTVRARPGELRQIIANLIGNAIDAIERENEPRITVAVRDSLGAAQLLVCDNGCGIQPSQQDRVFEPFFTTKPNVGTGLGLYLARELAEKNGGALQLESSVSSDQHGTTFYLTLPVASSVPKPTVLRRVV